MAKGFKKINERWLVRLVPVGGKYGMGNKLTAEKEPLVEFYDARYPMHGDPGQFVARYNLTTFLAPVASGTGLILDAGIPDWRLSAAEVKKAAKLISYGGQYSNPRKKGRTMAKRKNPRTPINKAAAIPKGKRAGETFTKGGKKYLVVSYVIKKGKAKGKRVRYARKV